MRETRIIMAMPISIELADERATQESLEKAFAVFTDADARFSTYKAESEISRINRGEIEATDFSPAMQEVLRIGEEARMSTKGYFTVKNPEGALDPSGVVKGWAIKKAAEELIALGHTDFMVDGSGDMAFLGKNAKGNEWSIGIQNPQKPEEIVKVIYPKGKGIATSGSMVRGAHIYNPFDPSQKLDDLLSITVIAEDVLTADIYATAAFAMGVSGVAFVEEQPNMEAYAIDKNGIATMTSGFSFHTTP